MCCTVEKRFPLVMSSLSWPMFGFLFDQIPVIQNGKIRMLDHFCLSYTHPSSDSPDQRSLQLHPTILMWLQNRPREFAACTTYQNSWRCMFRCSSSEVFGKGGMKHPHPPIAAAPAHRSNPGPNALSRAAQSFEKTMSTLMGPEHVDFGHKSAAVSVSIPYWTPTSGIWKYRSFVVYLNHHLSVLKSIWRLIVLHQPWKVRPFLDDSSHNI